MKKATLGFTLVEILIALALSSVLMLGILSLFPAHFSLYKTQLNAIENLENNMLFQQTLKNKLANVNNWQCHQHDKHQSLPQQLGFNAVFHEHDAIAIFGIDNQQTFNKIKPESDILYLQVSQLLLISAVQNKQLQLANVKLKKNDYVLLDDCHHQQINRVSSVSQAKNGEQMVRFNNTIDSHINKKWLQAYKMEVHRYSIQKGRNDQYALYLAINHKPAQELLSNVSDMQITYAEPEYDQTGRLLYRHYHSAEALNHNKRWSAIDGLNVELSITALDKHQERKVLFNFTVGG